MALSIDSAAVLRAIADHPDAFPAIRLDLDDHARKLLGKQLKAKSTDFGLLCRIYDVVGETNMASVLDSYAANELAALVKKIDPHSPHVTVAGDPKAVRAHIAAVATGRAVLSAKPEKAARARKSRPAAAAPATKIGGVLESKVHSGTTRAGRARKAQ